MIWLIWLNRIRVPGACGEIIMTDRATFNALRAAGWQLFAEFGAPGLPDSDRQLLAQVMGATQDLKLQPLQLERICEAFTQALSRFLRKGERAPLSAVRVRIWVRGPCSHDGGWGFFLVEKQGEEAEGATAGGASEHLVELFLYQERQP